MQYLSIHVYMSFLAFHGRDLIYYKHISLRRNCRQSLPQGESSTHIFDSKHNSCVMNETKEQQAKPIPMAATVDQWKETEIGKTRKKYEKLSEQILSWEDKKRKKAKRKLHRTERRIEKTRMKAMQTFAEENERIEIIVASARAHAYESQRKEELKVKEKANLMRTTGRNPSTCL